MSPTNRGVAGLVGRPWFWVLGIGILFGLPLMRVFSRDPPQMPEVHGHVPAFALTNQEGKAFGSANLQGHVWVAGLYDGEDSTRAMKVMHDLERRMRKLGDGFQMVSVAVHPDRDTTDKLFAYARDHKTNARRWSLVTGDAKELGRLRAALPIDPSRKAMDPLVLVDGRLRIRGIYDLNLDDKQILDQLIYDAALLVNDY